MPRKRGLRGGERKALAAAHLEARDGNRCWYCDGQFVDGRRTMTVDHVVPLSHGGTNEVANLRLACSLCNQRKGALGVDAFLVSTELAARRLAAARENRRILGAVLPRSAYCHVALRWYGSQRWACHACHLSSVRGTRRASSVPCLPMSRWPAARHDDT